MTIKSKDRVKDHGEVFTPPWLVEKMLDLVKGETKRIDSRFLEPACGSGNFLIPILRRKLAAVELKFGDSDFENRHYSLFALMCIYGVELLPDNISECKERLITTFSEYLNIRVDDELYRAASCVLSLNIVQGDTLTMLNSTGDQIKMSEWSYFGDGKFNRRDLPLASLIGQHDIFIPYTEYPQTTVSDLSKEVISSGLWSTL